MHPEVTKVLEKIKAMKEEVIRQQTSVQAWSFDENTISFSVWDLINFHGDVRNEVDGLGVDSNEVADIKAALDDLNTTVKSSPVSIEQKLYNESPFMNDCIPVDYDPTGMSVRLPLEGRMSNKTDNSFECIRVRQMFWLQVYSAITRRNKPFEVMHAWHLQTTRDYLEVLRNKIGVDISLFDMSIIAFAHDIFKEDTLDMLDDDILVDFIESSKEIFPGMELPSTSLPRYISANTKALVEMGLYKPHQTPPTGTNNDHGLAAGIFLYKSLGITDPRILYPVIMHSTPIVSKYNNFQCDNADEIRSIIDMMVLADKLSKNYLKINFAGKQVRCDLDKLVFGEHGDRFNYTVGLVAARAIGNGKDEYREGLRSLEMYIDRMRETENPFIKKNINHKTLGDKKVWPKRNSQVLPTCWTSSGLFSTEGNSDGTSDD